MSGIAYRIAGRIGLGAALIVATSTSIGAQQLPVPLRGMDQYIEGAMKDWGIAGMSVAVVKNDSIVYLRGFGVREVGKPERVDANTIFAIGSNTKLFTSVAAGMLVDDGKLRWDAPVTTYLPDFRLYDPWVTHEVTIRDLLSHRTGLGDQAGNMIALASGFDRGEILRRVRNLKPSYGFRSRFAYQNLMLLAAGEAAAAAAGESWDEFVATRIVGPLGMTRTNTSAVGITQLPNVAAPHTSNGTVTRPIPWRNIDNIGPAGSINSTAADMAKWVRFLLDDGRVGGRQLLQHQTLHEIESPQTIIPCSEDSLRPSTHFCAYGLGVLMSDYMGVKVLTHTGGIDGMLSSVTFVPELGLGIVVLTNTDGHNALFAAVGRQILDAYLGAPHRDWSTKLLSDTRKQERALAAMDTDAEARRPKIAPPTLNASQVTGRYANDMYGDVRLTMEESGLVLHFGASLTGLLTPWAYDTYKVTWHDDGSAFDTPTFVTFVANPLGRVIALRIRDDLARPPGMRNWDADEFVRVGDVAQTIGGTGARRPRPISAIGEVLFFETIPYSVNRWIGKKPEDQTTLQSWSYNLRRGWGWDNDHFPVNHFAHPYSGALFYNGARANGYQFWQSTPFAMGGSVAWEYFGETSRPSINDLINTTLGGITLGETMYRLSSVVLDDHATGAGRVAREIGAALIDPPHALSRILGGDVSRIGSHRRERPSTIASNLEVGYQRLDRTVDRHPDYGPRQLFADYSLTYGHPLAGDVKHPFDAFRLEGSFSTGTTASISEMRALGFLGVHDLDHGVGQRQQLALAMHYHYNNNRAFVTGGQGFSGGLVSRYPIGRTNAIQTEVWLTGIVLGAVKSDFGAAQTAIDSGRARSYDYGPGAGARLLARYDRGRRTLIDVTYQPFWYSIMSGVARSQFYDICSVRGQLPLFGDVALGARQVVYRRLANYALHPTTHSVDGQTQAFAAVSF